LHQSQISGHGSTNVQVGHVSAPTFNNFTIYVGAAEQTPSASLQTPARGGQQIANFKSDERIDFIFGNYNAVFFCLTARVLYISNSFPKKSSVNNTITSMSNVFFSDGGAARFRITMPTDIIPCAPDTDVTVVFASNANEHLLACGIYDDASSNHVYLQLESNWANYLNNNEFLVFRFFLLFCLISLGACLYLGIWSIYLIFTIPTIGPLFVCLFSVFMFTYSVQDMRKHRIERLVEHKHDDFLAHLHAGTCATP
jgi:hypothetical protein